MVTTMLDWAAPRGIGFSKIVSLGDKADVDFGDLLDYLAMDADTRAILLYAESIAHARTFMSAARIAARSKPVIVIKGGRHAEGARAAASHTGALAGARSEEHTSELQSLMRISYAVICLNKITYYNTPSPKI